MRGSDNHKPRVVLASRKNAGIRVKLLSAADTNTVAVLVHDDSTNEQFELLVEPDANPIDVHEHPYAYAAWRGIDYRTCGRRPETSEATQDMDATTLATEATRYLEVIDLFRSLELNVKWRSEADEVGVTLVGLPWLGLFLANGPADEIRATKRHQFLGPGGPDDPFANDPSDG